MIGSLEKLLVLQRSPLLSSLAADELLAIAGLCTEVALERGGEILQPGSLGEAMFVLVRGEISVEGPDGTAVLARVGDTLGEVEALDWEPHEVTAVALGPALLLRLDRYDLQDSIAHMPRFADNLARALVARLRARRPIARGTSQSFTPEPGASDTGETPT